MTATKRHGGLDVTAAALRAQTCQPDLWVIADELYDERVEEVEARCDELEFDVVHVRPRVKPEGYYSDLPKIYNDMISIALEHECDLAISLQDYVWVDAGGVQLFVQSQQERPGSLVAGLCSMLRRPDASAVVDPSGLWTVFADPFSEPEDRELEWADCRGEKFHLPDLQSAHPIEWEMNWSAFPLDVCEQGVLFDESFGEHIGHENQQFAWDCHMRADRPVLVQPGNHALSLPHRHYFPQEWDEQQQHREENLALYRRRYGTIEHLHLGRGR